MWSDHSAGKHLSVPVSEHVVIPAPIRPPDLAVPQNASACYPQPELAAIIQHKVELVDHRYSCYHSRQSEKLTEKCPSISKKALLTGQSSPLDEVFSWGNRA